MTVYPPNTPAKLVPRVLPTKIQVKINIYALTQLFSEFDKTCKRRITPCGLTEGEMGFEQTKECYLTEVIPFFKTVKEHFKGIQTTLIKEVKEIKEIFEQMEAEVEQYDVDKICAEIERKNLLIENENLLADCLSNELLYSVMNAANTISRFSEIHDAYTVEQARNVELEVDISKLKHKIQKEDYSEMIKHFSNLKTSQDDREFESFFEINKMKEQLQGKDNTIKRLKVKISHINERRRKEIRRIRATPSQENAYSQFPIRHIHLLPYVDSTCLGLRMMSRLSLKNDMPLRDKLSIFRISLAGAAGEWLKKDCIGSVTTWDDLVEKFVQKFYQLSYHNEEDDGPGDITDIFKIEGNLFDFETPLCEAFNDFNYLLKIDKDLVPYQLYDHICEPYRFKNGITKWPTCSSDIDRFCNSGELPEMVRVGSMTYFQDHKCFGNFHKLDYNVLVKLQECWWKINAHEVAPFTRLESYGQKSYANIKTEKAHDPYLEINNIFGRNYDTSNTGTQDNQGHNERRDDPTVRP
ncbi:hypothetical protein Tco_0961262 [Tanacetum coccineum]